MQRTLLTILVAPLTALLLGMAWGIHGPGDAGERLIWSGILFLMLWPLMMFLVAWPRRRWASWLLVAGPALPAAVLVFGV